MSKRINSIGFTGTRLGLDLIQEDMIVHLIKAFRPLIIRHGMCGGGDEQFHELLRKDCRFAVIHGHPSDNDNWHCPELDVDHLHERKKPLDRNRDIVDGSDMLIGAVHQSSGEASRSGTWATIRYAAKQNKLVLVVRPQGLIEIYNEIRNYPAYYG